MAQGEYNPNGAGGAGTCSYPGGTIVAPAGAPPCPSSFSMKQSKNGMATASHRAADGDDDDDDYNNASGVTSQDKYEDAILAVLAKLIRSYPQRVEYELGKYGILVPKNATKEQLVAAVVFGVHHSKELTTALYQDIVDMESGGTLNASGGYFSNDGTPAQPGASSLFGNILAGAAAATNMIQTIGNISGGKSNAKGNTAAANQQKEDMTNGLNDAVKAQDAAKGKSKTGKYIMIAIGATILIVGTVLLIKKFGSKTTTTAPAA